MIPHFQTNQDNNYFVVQLKFKGVKCATTLVRNPRPSPLEKCDYQLRKNNLVPIYALH